MFSLVIYDRRDGSFAACRDHVGKTPMYVPIISFHFILHVSYYFSISMTFSPRIFRYIGYGADGSKWFASEMKGSYILRVVIIILIAPVIQFLIRSSLLQLSLLNAPDSSPSHPVTFTHQRRALSHGGTSLTGWR